jgi:hypothetical protein
MPSQEFYTLLEMLIYPDVVEPEVLRENMDPSNESAASTSHAALPFLNISPN